MTENFHAFHYLKASAVTVIFDRPVPTIRKIVIGFRGLSHFLMLKVERRSPEHPCTVITFVPPAHLPRGASFLERCSNNDGVRATRASAACGTCQRLGFHRRRGTLHQRAECLCQQAVDDTVCTKTPWFFVGNGGMRYPIYIYIRIYIYIYNPFKGYIWGGHGVPHSLIRSSL